MKNSAYYILCCGEIAATPLTGRTRARPGLDQALAAVREGDTLVIAKLDRLARSATDAREIAIGRAARGIRLDLGRSVYDPTEQMGKMFFKAAGVSLVA